MKVLGNYPPNKKIRGNVDLNPSLFIGLNLPLLWNLAGLKPAIPRIRAFDGQEDQGLFVEEDDAILINNNTLNIDMIAIQMKGANLFGALWGMIGEYVRSVYVKQMQIPPEEYLSWDVSRRAGLAPSYVDEVERFFQAIRHQPYYEREVDNVVVTGIVNALFATADIDGHDVNDDLLKGILTARGDWVNPVPFQL